MFLKTKRIVLLLVLVLTMAACTSAKPGPVEGKDGITVESTTKLALVPMEDKDVKEIYSKSDVDLTKIKLAVQERPAGGTDGVITVYESEQAEVLKYLESYYAFAEVKTLIEGRTLEDTVNYLTTEYNFNKYHAEALHNYLKPDSTEDDKSLALSTLYAEAFIEGFQPASMFAELDRKAVKVDGVSALMVDYNDSVDLKKNRNLMTLVFKNDKVYDIAAWGFDKEFSGLIEEFKAAVESVKFGK